MPRFYFDVHDTFVSIDEEGQELADLTCAIRHAISALPEIAAIEIPKALGGDRVNYVVVVRDAQRKPVYSAVLSFCGTKL